MKNNDKPSKDELAPWKEAFTLTFQQRYEKAAPLQKKLYWSIIGAIFLLYAGIFLKALFS